MTAGTKPAATRDAPSKAADRAKDRQPRHAVPLLEWIVAGLGVLLVGGAIGYLVFHSTTRGQTPPDIRVGAEQVLDLNHGYVVQFRARNEGGSAAAQVAIEGELVGPDGAIERGEAVIDYLPPRSDRTGGLLFTGDPRRGELRLRATGYAKP
jgi:uncharacterized protein (TIGR02588 family)